MYSVCVCLNNLSPHNFSFSGQKFQLENLSPFSPLLRKLEHHILFIGLANCESELTLSHDSADAQPSIHWHTCKLSEPSIFNSHSGKLILYSFWGKKNSQRICSRIYTECVWNVDLFLEFSPHEDLRWTCAERKERVRDMWLFNILKNFRAAALCKMYPQS